MKKDEKIPRTVLKKLYMRDQKAKSYAHPLMVLISLQNAQQRSRFAVSAGRSVGNAVCRNRAKRLLRESLRPIVPEVAPGWDLVWIARQKIIGARMIEIRQGMIDLLQRAHLLREVINNS